MGNFFIERFFKRGKEEIQTVAQDFFNLNAIDISGEMFEFKQLKKYKAILVVNIASQCGLAKSHFSQLVELHQQFNDDELQILTFPCNQFLNQETKCERDIEKFIRQKFKPKFLIFSKVKVNGPDAHQVFKYLRTNSSLHDPISGLTQEIPYNFSKFLIDQQGFVRGFYPPTIEPNQLVPAVKQLVK